MYNIALCLISGLASTAAVFDFGNGITPYRVETTKLILVFGKSLITFQWDHAAVTVFIV